MGVLHSGAPAVVLTNNDVDTNTLLLDHGSAGVRARADTAAGRGGSGGHWQWLRKGTFNF